MHVLNELAQQYQGLAIAVLLFLTVWNTIVLTSFVLPRLYDVELRTWHLPKRMPETKR